MRVTRSLIAGGLVAALMAACSGSPNEVPDGTDGGAGSSNGPAVSVAPVSVAPGDAGANTGGGTGQIHIEIGGPAQATVDLPFFSFGSRFDGDVAGVNLNFATDARPGIATITGVADGTYIIGYVGDEGGFNAQTCELVDWSIGTSSGAGSFDCTEGYATMPDGSYLTGITMTGSFQAGQ